jgi:hypothetical protein
LVVVDNSWNQRDFNLGGRSSSTDNDSAALKVTAAMSLSFEARDAEGNVIHISNGVARSEQITISGYSDIRYSTKLRCSIETHYLCIAMAAQLPFQVFLMENTNLV